MKYCPRCGTELTDESAYCPKCGAWQHTEQQSYQDPYDQTSTLQNQLYSKGPTTVCKVFLVLSCVSVALLILMAILFTSLASNWTEEMYHSMVEAGFTFTPDEPQTGYMVFTIFSVYFWIMSLSAAWVVPMTINYFKKSKANKSTTLAYKICTLFFVNFIAGIIMLCCEKNGDNNNASHDQYRDRI